MSDLDRLADDYNAMRRERDEALAEAERWRNAHHEANIRLQAHDCGEEHARMLGYFVELQGRVEAAGEVIAENGCDCPCDHDAESHDEQCERCLACRISHALWPSVSK
jgi:hypothetical protein